MLMTQAAFVRYVPPAGAKARRRWAKVSFAAGLVTAFLGAVGGAGRAFGYLIVDDMTGYTRAALVLIEAGRRPPH